MRRFNLMRSYNYALGPGRAGKLDLSVLSDGICLAAWQRDLGIGVNGHRVMRSEIVREEAANLNAHFVGFGDKGQGRQTDPGLSRQDQTPGSRRNTRPWISSVRT